MSFGSCSPEEEMGGQLQKDKIVRHASIREAVKNLLLFLVQGTFERIFKLYLNMKSQQIIP